ncbi:hypothetical protein [Microbacterium oleivorans]|uniref:Uncharacterized protein n=1 Tax=Microbacterium oleivorans TaxID=273677 RepID=A0A4V3B3L0_9MICO|nr:hypothetical protein [Microbacterium oleivorans]TDL45293.1 hypothetical protein E2R54_02175 [Microbacterium oleivorans]
MIAWVDLVWSAAGAAVGAPISAAMGTLPERNATRGVSLRAAQHQARAETDWRVRELLQDFFRPQSPSGSRRSGDDDAGALIVAAFILVVVVGLYARFVIPIAVAMFLLSAICMLVTVCVFGVLWWRRVFNGRANGWLLTLTVLYAGVGALVALWLVEPPLHGVVTDAAAAVEKDGLGAVIPFLVPLLFQLVGAVASFALLVSSIGLCIANVTSVLIAVRAWGFRWLWRPLFWAARWTTGRWAAAVMISLGILAPMLASGLALDWAYQLSE